MIDWQKKLLIGPEARIVEALKAIDQGGIQIVLVVDSEMKLLGTVTDGDVRRGILKGIGIDGAVQSIMNPKPTVALESETLETVLRLMKERCISQIPVVNDRRQVIRVETLNALMHLEDRENWVVLMAGGLGTRLRPLTEETPKPLLKIGNKRILETTLENFIRQGFKKFFFSVNYLAEQIVEFFGDGSAWGVQIKYLHEGTPLGTAGALSLLPPNPTQPIIVMNADLVTDVSFVNLIEFHSSSVSDATMCVREYEFQVPFGVVNIDGDRLRGVDEKPVHKFFVNAGIYVLNPDLIKMIPQLKRYDITSLFNELIEKKKNVGTFPLREMWLDIGRFEDFQRANLLMAEPESRE